MFKSPNRRLSASNSAVISESFLVPMTLHSEARGSEASFEGLRRAFQEVEDFVSKSSIFQQCLAEGFQLRDGLEVFRAAGSPLGLDQHLEIEAQHRAIEQL